MTKLNESGRSMVEMLGVLAIIGVLSIGGISGYTMAMNRYKANEVINAAAMVSIANQSSQGNVVTTSDLGITGLDCTVTGTKGSPAVTIGSCTSDKVLQTIQNITGGTSIDANGKWTCSAS